MDPAALRELLHLPDPAQGPALIMGLGLFGGGVASARFLASLGYQLIVTDLRSSEALAESVAALDRLPVEFRLGEHRPDDFARSAVIVKNPAVKPGNEFIAPCIERGQRITSDIELFCRACPAQRVLAVTGSNGKTTTAYMAHAMLEADASERGYRAWLGGNMGKPLLESLQDINPGDAVVLELSSFQLMDLDQAGYSPTVSAITNITPNHLDWHRDMAEYVRAKSAIFRHQSPNGVAVLNIDDPITARLADSAPGRIVRVTSRENTAADLHPTGEMAMLHGSALFERSDLKLPGAHNFSNALVAAAMAASAAAQPASIRRGLQGFHGVEHRLEWVRTMRGVDWYNDSIATTPESTIAALRAFPDRPIYLLLGGSDKGLGYTELAEAIAMHQGMRVAYVTGPVGPRIAEAIHEACRRHPDPNRYLRVEPLAEFSKICERAKKTAAPGSVFLMSPACASFYEYEPGKSFRNFEERGRYFKQLVADYAE